MQVDEAGTIGAAATAGAVVLRKRTAYHRIDHPFLFVIRNNLTGA